MPHADFVHYDLGQQQQGSVVEVTLAHRANVLLLDSTNLRRYRSGSPFDYFGGEAVQTPYRVQIPHSSHWHVVLDLGGATGTIESSVSVLPRAA